MFCDVEAVIENYSGYARKVLDYSQLMKELVQAANRPDFSAKSWAPIEALVDVDKFQRVGNFKEVMSWQQYITFLTDWAKSAEWDCSFKRITERGDLVFLELEERSKVGDFSSVVNSVSVYEFNREGNIEHIDIYLQMEMPSSEMLASYENVELPS